MNVLVLGSEGQIGKPLVNELCSLDYNVTEWDKVNTSDQDLSYPINMPLLMDAMSSADRVVFLAFEVGGSNYLKKYDQTFDYIHENTLLMANTFAALEATRKPFIFASSQMSNMYHTNYGFLKDLGERYTKTLQGWICKFWNVYGYEDPNSLKSHVITDFISMAKKGNIRRQTNGLEQRQFLYIDDCIEALSLWCKNPYTFDKNEYLDITSFEWTHIGELARIISRLTGCTVTESEKFDKLQYGYTNEPSEYILKFWQPRMPLEMGIKKLL